MQEMKKISSELTMYFKKIVPIVLLFAITIGILKNDFFLLIIGVPLAVFFTILSFYLNEAYISSKYILIRNSQVDIKICLDKIDKVHDYNLGVIDITIVYFNNVVKKKFLVLLSMHSLISSDKKDLSALILKYKRDMMINCPESLDE